MVKRIIIYLLILVITATISFGCFYLFKKSINKQLLQLQTNIIESLIDGCKDMLISPNDNGYNAVCNASECAIFRTCEIIKDNKTTPKTQESTE